MMKFALFLVCALVAIQGLQARSVDPEERSIADVINKIKEVVEKIKNAISELAAQIPWIINHVKEKVTEILVKIPNLVIDIKAKTNEIVREHGEVGQKCVDAHSEELRGLVVDITNGIKECVPKAGTNFDELKLQISALIAHANELQSEVVNSALKCAADHPINPIALVSCLLEVVNDIKGDVATLEQEVKDLIAEGQVAAQAARIALTTCVAEVETETIAKENAVFDQINACVNA